VSNCPKNFIEEDNSVDVVVVDKMGVKEHEK
jgi:hypothetical protein